MTDTDLMTMGQFIADHGITMEVEGGTDRRHLRSIKPVKDDDGWEHFAWTVHLKRKDETMTVPYRMGTGHATIVRALSWEAADHLIPTPPKVEDVLDSLALDASAYENARGFEDFAGDFGYDTDSRKAERMYLECGETAKRLRFFLGGHEAFDQLLYRVERL